tara:strand:- start:2 stop:637 length:636 start_codon:yes stop_codon:yes gene_type:complete
MNKQDIFKYNFKNKIRNQYENFYTNSTNIEAFESINSNYYDNVYLFGPKKSGKSYLGSLWKKNNNAKIYKDNFYDLLKIKSNLLIDNFSTIIDQEKLFHIINHCILNNTRILIISSIDINKIKLKTSDLKSRIKSFKYIKINQPDDDMLRNILLKMFIEKQFIINSYDIFDYIISRGDRTYQSMYEIVNKLDILSLQKKRQLTIPLIKEIL